MERIDDVEYDIPEYNFGCCECDDCDCDCCDDCEDCDGEDEEDDEDPPEFYHGTFFGSFGRK